LIETEAVIPNYSLKARTRRGLTILYRRQRFREKATVRRKTHVICEAREIAVFFGRKLG